MRERRQTTVNPTFRVATHTYNKSTMSLSSVPGIDPSFLEHCLSIAISKDAGRTKAGTQSPVPPSSTLVPPTALEFDKADQTRLTNNYPDAYTDTYGTVSGQPFVYKTGPAWPKPKGGPNAQPFHRELRPVNDHPIMSSWDGILTDVEAYLKEVGQGFTVVMGFGFANAGEKTPFCPLVMTIGVKPETVAFEDAKAVADSVKMNILAKASFPTIEVAIWEFTTTFLGIGAKLPSLDPLVDGAVTEFRHPFASTLGIAVAPLKETKYEGTLGLFLSRGNGSDDILALTAAHVARPPPMFPDNRGLSEKAASRHHEEIVALGEEAFRDAITRIEATIGNLQECINADEKKIKGLRGRLERGIGDAERTTAAIEAAEQGVKNAKENIKQLNLLHTGVTKFMSIPDNRCIGHVLFADPIGVSSDGPNGYTRDWAVIEIRKDAFASGDFQGNKVYIGDKLNEATFRELMFPNVADRDGYKYPEEGLLQISGVVPENEILKPTQLNANGDPAMAVVKNGRTTGTTVGWVSGLKSLVRHYDYINIDFTSRETTIIPYGGGRGAFSAAGDSGSSIVERNGRMVGLLTGGGGMTNETNVTFATLYCELEKRIKEALPSVHLYN